MLEGSDSCKRASDTNESLGRRCAGRGGGDLKSEIYVLYVCIG